MEQHCTRQVLVQLSVTPQFRQFALPELKTVLRKMGIPLQQLFKHQILIDKYPKEEYDVTPECFTHYPFIILNVPDYYMHEKYLQTAAKKCVMISKIVLLIAYGSTYDELIKNANQQILQKYARNWDTLVHCDFSSRNRTISRQQQVPKITKVLSDLNVWGKVNANQPERIFDLIEDHKWFQGHHLQPSENTVNRIYFGVEVSNFRDLKNRKFNLKFQLPNRIYLGPTSTDNDLAFLMIHQCSIEAGDFVLDPFVGTGGLLVPLAYYGVHAFGSDLDIRVLNGYSVGKINKKSTYYSKQKDFQLFTPKVMLPFQQYGLIRPQIFRMDCMHSQFRCKEIFDAIVCDPPYGIRAMSRSLNKEQIKTQVNPKQEEEIVEPEIKQSQQQPTEEISENKTVQQSKNPTHELTQQERKRWKKQFKRKNKVLRKANIPKQQVEEKIRVNQFMTNQKNQKWQNAKIDVISKAEIYTGLLNYANEYLRPGKNLVFLYPVMVDENFQGTAEELPSHKNFKLLDYSINKLAKGNIRILVTMRKCSPI